MKSLSAVFAVLLWMVGTVVPATAGEPTPDLKGVKTVSYHGVADQNQSPCAIDLRAWNTAIDFVANQSTKLKLIRYADHLEQVKQLRNEANKAVEKSAHDTLDQTAKKEHDEAQERFDKSLWIPALLFSVQTMDIGIGCTGTVDAKVSVRLEPSKIIATGQIAPSPYMTIWNADWLLTHQYATFSSSVIQTSEQILKSFVNDWAKSQEE
jgi:hypothetical protein